MHPMQSLHTPHTRHRQCQLPLTSIISFSCARALGAFTMFPLIVRDQLRIVHFTLCVLFLSIWGVFLLVRGDIEQPHPLHVSTTTSIDQKKENVDGGGTVDVSSNGKERTFHKIFNSDQYLQQKNDASQNGKFTSYSDPTTNLSLHYTTYSCNILPITHSHQSSNRSFSRFSICLFVTGENQPINGVKRTKASFRIAKKRFDISDIPNRRSRTPQRLRDMAWTKW